MPRAEIADALVKELLATGLLVRHAADASLVLAPVQVYPVDLDDGTTLLVATDWPIESVHLASASRVMPIGVDSLTLALGMPAGLCANKRVLDVCCGSGIQALAAAAAGASHVTASDISPRAVRFTQFNAALNAQPSVIALCGARLDAVCGERFDVILANPPFVAVPPGVSDDARARVTGGADGADFVRRLMRDADGALARGGCLLVVTQLPNPDEAHSWLARASGGALEVAFVYDPRHTQSAAVYAAEHAADSGAASSDAWRAGLEAAGVASIGFGVFAARRVADGDSGGGGSIRVTSGSARHGMLDGRRRDALRDALGAFVRREPPPPPPTHSARRRLRPPAAGGRAACHAAAVAAAEPAARVSALPIPQRLAAAAASGGGGFGARGGGAARRRPRRARAAGDRGGWDCRPRASGRARALLHAGKARAAAPGRARALRRAAGRTVPRSVTVGRRSRRRGGCTPPSAPTPLRWKARRTTTASACAACWRSRSRPSRTTSCRAGL